MSILKKFQNPYLSLLINMSYAVGNCVVGFAAHSWWFTMIGAYYAVLASARFCVIRCSSDTEAFAKRMTGILLIGLSFCLIGINVLAAVKERGTHYHEIIMITIALYSFIRLTAAAVGLTKAKQNSSQITRAVRNIAFADAVVSIYSLQRSMLVSFPGMEPSEIQLLNIFTGTAVWMIVLFLGINLLGGKYVDMAKSRIVKVSNKIAEAVTGGYKKIEQSVVGGYTKIEDKFVEAYLTHEGETVEEAKARLRKENR